MEAAVAAFLIVGNVILLVEDLQVLAGTDIFRHSADILDELAHDANAGNILDSRLQILHFYI
ncbi:hypothetical protein D3C73_1512730 [compost metagenome]